MAYPPKLQELLDLFALLPDRQERIQALISTAERFSQVKVTDREPPYPEPHRVPGCESEAFVFADYDENGHPVYRFDVLNPQGMSAMAMAVILGDALSGESPESIEEVSDQVVYDLFGRELSMGKSMGLTQMVALVKFFARPRSV